MPARFNLSSFEKPIADLGRGDGHDIALRLPSGQVVKMSQTQYLNSCTAVIQGIESFDTGAILQCTHVRNGGKLVDLVKMVIGE